MGFTISKCVRIRFMITIDALFQSYQTAVEHYPQTPALIGPECQLSLAQLHNKAQEWLPILQSSGAAILYFHPSCAFYSAVVAGMLAGVPLILLDPESPVPEMLNPLADRVLTSSDLKEQASRHFPDYPIYTHESAPLSPVLDPPEAPARPKPAALHQLVTSGSSGQSSFVTIGRDAVVLHTKEMGLHYPYPPYSLNANLTRHTSAAGINGFWRVILSGAGLIFSDLKQESLSALYQRLKQHPLHSLQGIAPLLEALAQIVPVGEGFFALKRIIFGGQSLTPAQLKKIAVILPEDCDFSFNYSSSETLQITAYSAPLQTVLARSFIPCGQALPSRDVRILGSNQEPLPAGEIGEIVVVAEHMALAIESPTAAERFYADPEHAQRQVYHTRDLGRWNEQGELEYLGRLDRQIKSKGVRIDPVRIEQVLETLPHIEAAVVLGLEHQEQTYLVACIVPVSTVEESALREQLTDLLPTAWIPHFWLPCDALPLQASGKIDYPALKKQGQARLNKQLSQVEAPPSVGLEEQLRQLWNKVLGYAIQGENPHFMLAGGDSLKASQLVSHLVDLGYGPLTVLWVAQHPNLKTQLKTLQNKRLQGKIQKSNSTHPMPQPTVLPQAHEKEKILQYLGWV
jgi:acyl-CoA synthetase (AMP-forming)/AMP-acid ligase II